MAMIPWKTTETIEIKHKLRTLSQTIEFHSDPLERGIIESIVTVSRFLEVLPFQTLKTAYRDPIKSVANQDVLSVSLAAKNLGRGYMSYLAHYLTRYVEPCSEPISFKLLDVLIEQVDDPDFLMMHFKLIRDIRRLYRYHGLTHQQRHELPSRTSIPKYQNIPIFRNDYMDTNSIIVGRFDNGTREYGISGLVPEEGFIDIESVRGELRISFAGEVGVFNRRAVAGLSNVHRM
jgi:hypothetical protein